MFRLRKGTHNPKFSFLPSLVPRVPWYLSFCDPDNVPSVTLVIWNSIYTDDGLDTGMAMVKILVILSADIFGKDMPLRAEHFGE